MEKLLLENPWLLVCILGAVVAVACTAIVFATDCMRKSRQAEIDAALKHDMLERGMSATEIKTVLEATAAGEVTRNYSQPVRVGLGRFQVEVGAAPAANQAERTAT
jgi:hypothetical protein